MRGQAAFSAAIVLNYKMPGFAEEAYGNSEINLFFFDFSLICDKEVPTSVTGGSV